jgi:hypothetical protein
MESIAGALEGCCWVCEQLAACWVWKLDRELSGLDVHELELVASGVAGTKRDFEDLEDDEEEELYPSKKVSN